MTRNLNTLMIIAIKKFNKTHKGCDIMKITTCEGDGKGNRYTWVLFDIEYIKRNGTYGGCEIGIDA